MKDIKELYFYYPKRWIKEFCDNNMIDFNWFLCGKKYIDDNNNLILEVPEYIKFYDMNMGISYSLKRKIKLLIFDKINSDLKKLIENYDGIVSETIINGSNDELLCHNIIFGIKDDVLVVNNSKLCDIIIYAKKYNKCIRSKIPSFPDPTEIDELLIKYKNHKNICFIVSKVLYDYLQKYFISKK